MQTFLFFVILLAGIVSLIFLIAFKFAEKEGYLKISLLCATIVILAALIKILFPLLVKNTGIGANSFSYNEDKYMELGGRYFGRYLSLVKEPKDGNNVLIIDYPENSSLYGAELSKYIIKGIKEGFKDQGNLYNVSWIEKAKAFDESRNWFTAKELDRIIIAHPNVDLVISLVGLPFDIQNVTFSAQLEKMPKFAFFGAYLDMIGEVASSTDFVTAVVTFAPGASIGSHKKPDLNKIEEHFFDHFILIDKDNLKSTKEVFPIYFK